MWYFPKSYIHLCRRMKALHENDKTLKFNFRNSVYPLCTFNLGPRTVCVAHRDVTNYPSVPCAVTALGNFDYKTGGHFVLYDFKLCVQFPPATTVLLSSAGLSHGNTALNEKHETRYSITQYCIGNLIKWVVHDFKPFGDKKVNEAIKIDLANGEGWKAQSARFSNFLDLDEDRKKVLSVQKEFIPEWVDFVARKTTL